MADTPVQAVRISATGSIWAGPGRVRGLSFVAAAAAGTIVLRDGGAGGTVLLTIDTPGSATWQDHMDFDGGIKFNTNIHCTLTNVSFVTFFIG